MYIPTEAHSRQTEEYKGPKAGEHLEGLRNRKEVALVIGAARTGREG